MSKEDQIERLKTTGRNDPCPCGSGKKYKKCHLFEDEAVEHDVMKKAADEREAALAAEAEAEGEGDDSKKKSKKSHTRLPGETDHSKGGSPKNSAGRPGNIPRRGAV